jgi:hypothetical protein
VKAAQRKKLPGSSFGLPAKAKSASAKATSGNYPIDTPARARNALARAAQHASPAEQAQIKRRVKAKYPNIDVGGKGKGKK